MKGVGVLLLSKEKETATEIMEPSYLYLSVNFISEFKSFETDMSKWKLSFINIYSVEINVHNICTTICIKWFKK